MNTRRTLRILCAFQFLLVFGVYLHTAAPSLTLIDSGELVYAAITLGNPHSPGYPVYTQLTSLSRLLPLGNQCFRVALLSCFGGAVASIVLTLLMFKWFGQASIALLCGFMLAFSRTFWQQAIMPEVYCLAMAGIFLLLLLIPDENNQGRLSLQTRWILSGFLLGLTLGIHQFVLFTGPALLIIGGRKLFSILRSFRSMMLGGMAFILGFSTNLFLPLRAFWGKGYCFEMPENFKAFYGGAKQVQLSWETLSEAYNKGFILERGMASPFVDRKSVV